MIKVFIADKHPLVRKMLKEILERESDMRAIGEASNTQEVMDGLRRIEADILITSLSLGGNGALNMIGDVKTTHSALPILVLTMHPEERFAVKTLRSGASGYLTKDIAPEEIINAVRTLVSGKPYITYSLAEKLAMESGGEVGQKLHDSLSAREFQIMCALASGKKTTAIAEELSISVNTVNSHKTRIMKKMKMTTMPELTLYAVQNNLIE